MEKKNKKKKKEKDKAKQSVPNSHLKIQLYNPVIFRNSPVVLGTNASKNETFGKIL